MALMAICSAKGSPGATVTALALTLTARRPVVLAECDPAGGDIAAGYLREVQLGQRGLGQLTASLHRGHLMEDFWGQLVDLAPGSQTALTRLLLPGLADPFQAARWAEVRRPGDRSGWQQLADLFIGDDTAARYDVIADCGRLSAGFPPAAVLAAANVVLLVVRPTLPSMRAAAVGLGSLRGDDRPPVGLVVVGDRPYGTREIAAQLGLEVVVTLPVDDATASVLSLGGIHNRGQLMRAATRAHDLVWRLAVRATVPAVRPIEVSHVR